MTLYYHFVYRVQADKEVTYNGFENSNNKFQQYLDCNTNYIRHLMSKLSASEIEFMTDCLDK